MGLQRFRALLLPEERPRLDKKRTPLMGCTVSHSPLNRSVSCIATRIACNHSTIPYQHHVMDSLASLIGRVPPLALLRDQYAQIHMREFAVLSFAVLSAPLCTGADFDAAAQLLRCLPLPQYSRASRATVTCNEKRIIELML